MSFVFSNPLPQDGVTTLAAASVVNPFNDVKTYAISHQSGAGYRHVTDAIDSEALAAGPVYTDASVHLQQRINQLAAAVSAIIGITGFSAAVAGLPATISAINTTLTNAAAAATPNRLVMRDSVGGAAFAWLNATNTNAGTIVASVSGANGQTANLVQVQGYGLTAGEALTIPPTGPLTSARQITAPQFNGALSGIATNIAGIAAVPNGGTGLATLPAHNLLVGNGASPPLGLAPGAANNLLFSNGTDIVSAPFTAAIIPDRVLPYLKLLNLSITGNPASLTVTVNPGSFVNSVGTLKTIASTPVVLTAPTTGSQYAEVWFNDAGSANVTYGTVGGSRDTAAASSPNSPQWVFLPQNCTGIYSSQADWQAAGSPAAKGYVDDRPVGGGSSGAAGGTSTSATVATLGPPATSGATNGAQLSAILAGTAVGTYNGENAANIIASPTIMKSVATDVSLAHMLSTYLFPDTLSRISVSGATVSLAASGSNPLPITLQGRQREATSALTATATGAAGLRYLIADCSAAGVTPWSLISPMPTSNSVAPYQYVLEAYWFDGTVLRTTTIDTSNVASIASGNVRDETVVAQGTGGVISVTGTGAYQINPAVPVVDFWLPKPATLKIFNSGVAATPTTSKAIFIGAGLDGTGTNWALVPINNATGAADYSGGGNTAIIPSVSAGHHTIQQNIISTAGTICNPLGYACAVYIEIMG